MTNREQLLTELIALPNEALYMAFADNRITRALDDAMCVDCKASHGRCVATGDDEACPVTVDDWLDMPSCGAPILGA